MNRMQVYVHQLPLHNSALKIETWPASMNKYYTKRDFKVREGDEVVVESTSNWLVMDIETRRLIAIPEYIKDAGFVLDRGNLPEIDGKVTYDETRTERQSDIQVSWFDLDINDHVNNTKIYQWILEGLGSDFLNVNSIRYVDILFKHEIKKDDILKSLCYWHEESGRWKHALMNAETKQLHALAESEFKEM